MKKIFASFILFISVLPILLSGCATPTPLMNASQKGDIHEVQALLNKGVDINERGPFKSTALEEAAQNGHFDIVKLLLDKGADVNSANAGSDTPLMCASLKGHTDVVRLLLERGADVKMQNMYGWTALAYTSRADIAKLLIDKGADVNAVNNYGGTPLSAAAMAMDRDDVAKILIDNGANLEAALSKCENTLEEWSNLTYMEDRMDQPKHCVALLKGIKNERAEAKRREQEIEKARIIESQKAKEMKVLIQEVLAATSGTQNQGSYSPSVQSDIDAPVFADSEKIIGENDVAVIIGIEGYQNIPKSDYSFDDAKLVKEYAKALGFKERNIEFLTDEKATLSGITKSLEAWLRNKAKTDSRVFVYYSGHGAPDPATGEAYIVPYDGDPNYLEVTGYPLKRLYANLGGLHVTEVVVVIDACFSGTGGRSVLAQGARPLIMMSDAPVISPNMAVLSATQGSQISSSSPEKGHGIFTYYFLKALKDGKKSLPQIYKYIKPNVEDDAKQLNVRQSPSIYPAMEKIEGKFMLRK